MSARSKFGYTLRLLLRRDRVDAELDEEIRFHLDMEADKLRRAGLSPREARRRARLAFGGVERTKESCREALGIRALRDVLGDAAFAARDLAKRKGFAASSLATLAICLGANAAFFAALDSVALRPLPFVDSERIVEIYRSDLGSGGESKLGGNASLAAEYALQDDLFAAVGYHESKWTNLQFEGHASRVNALHVSDGLFAALALEPELGTLIGPESPDGAVVVSRSLWEQRFQKSESILGATLLLDGRPRAIAGVAPRAAEAVEPWVGVFAKIDGAAQRADPRDEALRQASEGTVWARLSAGVSEEQARLAIDALESRFRQEASDAYRQVNDADHLRIEVVKAQEERSKWARPRLYLLNASALLVLAIGCVNVSNLMLANASARAREFWTRRSLGATPGRILRQCVAEVSLLAIAGWALSVPFALICIRTLEARSDALFRSEAPIAFGLSALLYSLGLTLACALALGLAIGGRALQSSRRIENSRSSAQVTVDRSALALRSLLTAAQTALTLALLIGAGLLVKSFYKVATQDMGFDPDGVATARIHLPDSTYGDEAARESFKDRLLEDLRAQAGFSSVAAASAIPSYGYPDDVVAKFDSDGEGGNEGGRAYFCHASPGYLDTLGIALLEGRDFEATDAAGWQDPVLVDERFARIHFSGRSAIGKRIRLGGPPRNPNNWFVIVGVVESAKRETLDGADSLPLVYLPLKGSWATEFSVFAKSRLAPARSVEALRSAVGAIDPGLPVFRAGSLKSLLAESLAARAGLLAMCLALGWVALLLAAIGMYGAAAFRLSQSLRELAIRMAIGATPSGLTRASVAGDLRLAAMGVLAGLCLAALGGRLIAGWLFAVSPFDWQVYGALALVVLAVSAASSYAPARRCIRDSRLPAI